jgi:lysophospholipase L1-like esterase
MKKQDFPWVQIEEPNFSFKKKSLIKRNTKEFLKIKSFQWNSFLKVIKILKARNNKVFVIIGPFNPYILTEESLNRYNIMKDKMEKWLEGEEISYRSISDLPSEYYADASHPLKEGYAKIAEELLETESFRIWMKNWHVSNFLKN